MADTRTGTKTAAYRKAFEALGGGATFEDFEAYCKDKLGVTDVQRSSYYSLRREYPAKEAQNGHANGHAVQVAAARVTAPPDEPAAEAPAQARPSVFLDELPQLLEQARGLVARFGGDKEACIRFLRAV